MFYNFNPRHHQNFYNSFDDRQVDYNLATRGYDYVDRDFNDHSRARPIYKSSNDLRFDTIRSENFDSINRSRPLSSHPRQCHNETIKRLNNRDLSNNVEAKVFDNIDRIRSNETRDEFSSKRNFSENTSEQIKHQATVQNENQKDFINQQAFSNNNLRNRCPNINPNNFEPRDRFNQFQNTESKTFNQFNQSYDENRFKNNCTHERPQHIMYEARDNRQIPNENYFERCEYGYNDSNFHEFEKITRNRPYNNTFCGNCDAKRFSSINEPRIRRVNFQPEPFLFEKRPIGHMKHFIETADDYYEFKEHFYKKEVFY